MKSIIFSLSLCVFAFSDNLVLLDKNTLESAKLDFLDAKYKKSYEKLKILFLKNPDDFDVNYHLAKASIEIKNYGMASAAYERILINEPNNLNIKFEQAKLLFLTGNKDASSLLLTNLLSMHLPISLKSSITKYLGFIQKDKRELSLEATFLLSINHSDNVNNAPEEKYILKDFDYLGIQGNDEIQDTSHLEYFDMDLSTKLNTNISIINNFTYFIKTYLDEKDENLEFYSYKPAISIKDGSKLYYLSAIFERYQPGYKSSLDYFDSVGFESRFFNKNYRIDLKAQRFFYRDESKKEKNYSRYKVGFRTFNNKGFNFSSSFIKDIAQKSTRTDINKISFSNNLNYIFKVGTNLNIIPSFRYKISNYKDESIAFNTRRKDKLSNFSLELKKYINKSSFISLETSYLNNESNQEEYDYESKSIGLVYVKRFSL
jgi:hypothetical protein